MDWTEVPATAVTLQIPCLHPRKAAQAVYNYTIYLYRLHLEVDLSCELVIMSVR